MNYEVHLQVQLLRFSRGVSLRPDEIDTLIEDDLLESDGVRFTKEGQHLLDEAEKAIEGTE